jgi:hypothetical protein
VSDDRAQELRAAARKIEQGRQRLHRLGMAEYAESDALTDIIALARYEASLIDRGLLADNEKYLRVARQYLGWRPGQQEAS